MKHSDPILGKASRRGGDELSFLREAAALTPWTLTDRPRPAPQVVFDALISLTSDQVRN